MVTTYDDFCCLTSPKLFAGKGLGLTRLVVNVLDKFVVFVQFEFA